MESEGRATIPRATVSVWVLVFMGGGEVIVKSVAEVSAIRRCYSLFRIRTLRPLIDIIGYCRIRPVERSGGLCGVCTILLGSASYNAVGCKQDLCSCRGNSVLFVTPKRMVNSSSSNDLRRPTK